VKIDDMRSIVSFRGI